MGKPSKFTPERFDALLARFRLGEVMEAACKAEGVSLRTVRDWIADDPALAAAFQEAKEDGEDAILADTLTIADKVDEEAASRKVRIYARHEYLKKRNPKRWSDKINLEHSGSLGVRTERDMTEAELVAIAQQGREHG